MGSWLFYIISFSTISTKNIMIFYFKNTKYTASTKHTAAAKWFHFNVSPWKKIIVKKAKMIRVITSWITLSWRRVNGPPFPWKPMRLAGIWQEYSKKAVIHDIKITPIYGQLLIIFISCNFKCPYQAKVMKTLETISNNIVYNPFIYC